MTKIDQREKQTEMIKKREKSDQMRKTTENEVEVGGEVGVVKEVEVKCELEYVVDFDWQSQCIFLKFVGEIEIEIEIITGIEIEIEIEEELETGIEIEIEIGTETENIVTVRDIV